MQLIIQAGDLGPKWFHVALRTLVLLASSDRMLKSHYIAEKLGEDSTYVRKILARLTKANYVKSQGGRYGGYFLNILPSEITVKDVYKAIGDTAATPFYTVPPTGVEIFISQIIEKAEKSFQMELAEYTIKDLLDYKNSQSSLKI